MSNQKSRIKNQKFPSLLIVVNVFEPDLGGGILFSDLSRGLGERGFNVTVRCAYSYYPEWKDKSGKNGLRIGGYLQPGLRVERFGLYIPTDPNALWQRLLYEGSFFASLMRRLPRRGDFDLIMAFCPLMGAVAYGAVCRRLNGPPLWLNVQDLPAEAAVAGGITSGGRVGRAMSGIQEKLFNQADVWSTISPVMSARLKEIRRHDQPILYLPNWLHESLAKEIRALPDRSDHLPAKPVRLLYSGNVGTKQDLLRFCEALRLSDASFSFRIRAGGSRASEVRSWVAEQGDARFSFHDLSDERSLARSLHQTDYLVITERAGSGGSFIPSKLIPALAAGTPVLAVCDAGSPLGREMEAARPGPRFDWEDLDQLDRLLKEVPRDQYGEWRRAASARSAFYDRTRILDGYADAIRDVIAGNSPGPIV
jgi:colanic acid biosynthesis glycosyl transferase WcaI